MKILIWSPIVNPGGGKRLLFQLIYGLSKHPTIKKIGLHIPKETSLDELLIEESTKIQILCFTQERPKSFLAWLNEDKRILSLKGIGWLKRKFRFLFEELPDWEEQQLFEASQNYDLIYVFWPHRQKFPNINKPIVCTFQDATFFDFPEILGGQATQKEWENSHEWLHQSDRVVLSSEATKIVLGRYFSTIDVCSFPVIHHAIFPAKYNREQISSVDLKGLPKQLPDQYFIVPANIMSHKNHDRLFDAWSRFDERGNYPLVLMGAGTEILANVPPQWPNSSQGAKLVGVLQRKGLVIGKDLFVLGYIDDKYVLPTINHALALIMPTLAEGGGSYPIEEALYLGVPVLCSDIPVLREHLSCRSAEVIWFDADSPVDILRAVHHFLKNQDHYIAVTRKGVDDYRPSWEEVASKYVQVFSEVLS